jgi:hypothetical protein
MEHILIIHDSGYTESISVLIEEGDIVAPIYQKGGAQSVDVDKYGVPAATIRVTDKEWDVWRIRAKNWSNT